MMARLILAEGAFDHCMGQDIVFICGAGNY